MSINKQNYLFCFSNVFKLIASTLYKHNLSRTCCIKKKQVPCIYLPQSYLILDNYELTGNKAMTSSRLAFGSLCLRLLLTFSKLQPHTASYNLINTRHHYKILQNPPDKHTKSGNIFAIEFDFRYSSKQRSGLGSTYAIGLCRVLIESRSFVHESVAVERHNNFSMVNDEETRRTKRFKLQHDTELGTGDK